VIRINLLPQTKRQGKAAAAAPGSSQGWVIGYLVSVVLWVIGLVVVYVVFSNELEEHKQQNQAVTAQIQVLKQKSSRLEEVRTKINLSRQLEEVVTDLNRVRLGPTRVMLELSKLLSKDGGPTVNQEEFERIRRENPLAGFNRNWQTQRLWVLNFTENNRNVRMRGVGKTNEDVAEFLQRLELSDLFEEVRLTRTSATTIGRVQYISFDASCKVRY